MLGGGVWLLLGFAFFFLRLYVGVGCIDGEFLMFSRTLVHGT